MEQDSGYGVIIGYLRSKDFRSQADRDTRKNEPVYQSKGWLPGLFRSIVSKAKDFLQNLIREHDMPPKPVLEIDMAEFRTMQKLMIKAQDKAKEIRHLQDTVLPKLKQQLAETKGIFKGKERKALTEQAKPPERESVLKRLRQLQIEGKQRNQPRQRKKSFDRDSR